VFSLDAMSSILAKCPPQKPSYAKKRIDRVVKKHFGNARLNPQPLPTVLDYFNKSVDRGPTASSKLHDKCGVITQLLVTPEFVVAQDLVDHQVFGAAFVESKV
jgi:hypothetical protein